MALLESKGEEVEAVLEEPTEDVGDGILQALTNVLEWGGGGGSAGGFTRGQLWLCS